MDGALVPRKLYPWLMIDDGDNGSTRTLFYNIEDKCCYVKDVPELKNKYIACCHGQLMVLRDKSTDECSMLNLMTMKTKELPRNSPYRLNAACVVSSSIMDNRCRVMWFERKSLKFMSCYLGEGKFLERKLSDQNEWISDLINFKGKLYSVRNPSLSLDVYDFSDLSLRPDIAVRGGSPLECIFGDRELHTYLVESCEDLLLAVVESYDNEISDIKIFKADFIGKKWVNLETLGDRALFLGSRNNSFSSPVATADRMKGNAIYWVRTASRWHSPDSYLYKYDIEDKSVSVTMLLTNVGTCSSLTWVSHPLDCDWENKPIEKGKKKLQTEQMEETKTHGCAVVLEKGGGHILSNKLRDNFRKIFPPHLSDVIQKRGWAYLHDALLLEILPRLPCVDRVAFSRVCKPWKSTFTSFRTCEQQVLFQPTSSQSPVLVCPGNKAYDPILGNFFGMVLPDLSWDKVRASHDGLLLVDHNAGTLVFRHPFTEETHTLADEDALIYYGFCFSASPNTPDFFAVAAVKMLHRGLAIRYKRGVNELWTSHVLQEQEVQSFYFSFCNGVYCEGLCYFLGYGKEGTKLLIFDPNKNRTFVHLNPEYITDFMTEGGQQYMLEMEGKVLAVFVVANGSRVCVCTWNHSMRRWERVEKLENFVVCKPSLLLVEKSYGTWNK